MAFSVRSLLPRVLPSERSRLSAALLAFTCVASGGILARTMGNTVFLSHYGADLLPLMYIGTAIILTIAAYVFGVLTGRFAISRLIVWTCMLLMVLSLGLKTVLTPTGWGGFKIIAYFLSDLVSKLPMMLFWTFAGLIFNPREAKRLFGFVGAAGTLACVVAGMIVKPFAAQFGPENLLVLVAAALFGFGFAVGRYVRKEPTGLSAPSADQKGGKNPLSPAYYLALFKAPLVRNIALLVITSVVALTLTDFVFKSQARANYPDGAELAGFFGIFFAGTNIVALAIQIFLVHLILQRGGVLVATAVLPAALLVTSLGVALTGDFRWIVASKFVDPVFDFTLNSAAMSMLYLGIKKQTRGQARAFVDGISKPAAVAVTGGALFVTAGMLGPRYLASVVVGACALWLILCWRNYKAYVAGLIDSLGARQFDLSQENVDFRDKAVEMHIRQSLLEASDDEVEYLLGILPEMSYTDWKSEHRALLSRERPEIKVLAIDYLRENGDDSDVDEMLAHVDHPDPKVRATAARAASALGGPRAIEAMERLLADNVPEVRAAAAVELINIGDLDGLLSASVALKSMLGSQDASSRVAAGDALAHIRHGRLTRALSSLLADSNNDVRMAALNACSSRPDLELMPYIVPLLSEPHIASNAAATIASFGVPAIEHLVAHYDVQARRASSVAAYHIPSILARIGDPAAIPLLKRGLHSPDLQLRREAVRAYCRLVSSLTSLKSYLADIDQAVAQEVEQARLRYEPMRRIAELEGNEILTGALRDEFKWHLENAFAMLTLKAPNVDMKTIYATVTGEATSDRRAEALEILDNVLDGAVKQQLLGLLESETAKKAKDGGDSSSRLLDDFLAGDHSEWVLAGAIHLVGESRLDEFRPRLEDLLEHAQPVVRETALHGLSKIVPSKEMSAICRRLEGDDSAIVRELATSLVATER